MTDNEYRRETDRWLEPGETNVRVIYYLYIAGLLFGITFVVGLVIAYINRGKAGATMDAHYTYLIRTFWIGLLFSIGSAVLTVILVGFVGFVATFVWFIARMVTGLQALSRGEPVARPETWLV
ncbi:MAG: hypothetical protein WAT70_13445 [Rhizobiaceae bacterium]